MEEGFFRFIMKVLLSLKFDVKNQIIFINPMEIYVSSVVKF